MSIRTLSPQEMQVESYIDAKDSVQKWCAAKIIELAPTYMLIRFDGWSIKWDAKVPYTSQRIAPFRKYSYLYTGQKKTALREWLYTIDEVEQVSYWIKSLLQTDLKCKNAWEITQFYRGQLFTLVDCLLTHDFREEMQDLVAIMNFFTLVIDLIVEWLKRAPELVDSYVKSLSNEELFMTDEDAALACCWPELLFTLTRLFALEERTCRFFKLYCEIPTQFKQSEMTIQLQGNGMICLLDYFLQQKGYDIIVDYIRDGIYPLEWIAKFPFIFKIVRYLAPEYSAQLIPCLKDSIINRIQNITNKEIKILGNTTINEILTPLAQMLVIFDRGFNAYQFVELTELNVTLKLINSPFLEKKIRGIKEIIQFITRLPPKAGIINTIIYNQQKQPVQRTSWLKIDSMIQWIQENRIVELVLKEHSHSETIKRTTEILIFLAKNESLSNEHLNLLWDCLQEKHDSIVLQASNLIIQITPYLQQQQHDYIYEKILQLESLDKTFLKMIKDFSQSAMDTQYRVLKTSQVYGIKILYKILVQDGEMSELAAEYLIEIIKQISARKKQRSLLQKSLERLSENASVCPTLKLMIGLLQNLPFNRNIKRDEILNNLDQVFSGLIRLVITSFQWYYNICRLEATNFENPHNSVFVGMQPHKIWIQRYLDVIELLCQSSSQISLDIDSIQQLWHCFVKEPVCLKDQQTFFKWMQKGVGISAFINKDCVDLIFNQFFSDQDKLDYENISTEAFQCFQDYFMLLNWREQKIDSKGGVFHNRIKRELIGINQLIQLNFCCKNEKVASYSRNFIIQLYTRIGRGIVQYQTDIWGDLISLCFKEIQKGQDDGHKVQQVLQLLYNFLNDIEEDADGQNAKLQLIFVRTLKDASFFKIWVNPIKNLGYLRKKIADYYKKPKNCIILNIGGIRYDLEDDHILISGLKVDMVIAEITNRHQQEQTPKQHIQNNRKIIELLFALLSNPQAPYIALAWKLLISLPKCQKIVSQLQELNEPLTTIFEGSSVYKQLYCFLIIEGLMNSDDWLQVFTLNGGPEVVFESFLTTEFRDSVLVGKYALVSTTILDQLLTNHQIDIDKWLNRLFDILTEVCKCWESQTEITDEQSADIPRNITRLLQKLITLDYQACYDSILQYENMGELINYGLIKCSNIYLNNSIVNLFLILTVGQLQLNRLFLELLLIKMDTALAGYYQNEGYWTLLTQMVLENEPDNEELKSAADKIMLDLKERQYESNANQQNIVLIGQLRVLQAMLKQKVISIDESLLNLVQHQCLFDVPRMNSDDQNVPKCKNLDTRREAFALLKTIAQQDNEYLDNTISFLKQFHNDPKQRGSKPDDWNKLTSFLERSSTGFVGLKNLGSTCYMNSIIQQLYMIQNFRDYMIQLHNPESFEKDSVIYQFQYILCSLKYSNEQFINPLEFTSTFKDWEGRPINTQEQGDVDEFFNTFMDQLEKQMPDDSENVIKNNFGGLQVTELIGKNQCKHRSEREEPFLTLPVQVKNKRQLQESLESFVEGELLEEDNAYQCDFCDTKVSALRRVCIKHLPNTLIIALRRFEFNFDSMTRIKVNDYCEFPMEIDMEPYTQEGLERKDFFKDNDQGKNKKEPPGRLFEDNYYKYKLKGVVIHIGTAEVGHYYSIIQDRESEEWYEFNDTVVRKYDIQDLPADAFGGEERWQTPQPANSVSKQKQGNAYLLVYERAEAYSPILSIEETSEKIQLDINLKKQVMLKQVELDCYQYWMNRNILSTDYFDFVLELARIGSGNIMKFTLSFFITALIRAKDLSKVQQFLNLFKHNLQDPNVAVWYLETITYPPVFQELIQECPIIEKRRFIVYIAEICMKIAPYDSIRQLLNRLLNRLKLVDKLNCLHAAQLFELIYVVISKNPNLMRDINVIPRLFSFYFDEKVNYPTLEEVFLNQDIDLGYGSNQLPPSELQKTEPIANPQITTYLLKCLIMGQSLLSQEQVYKLTNKTTIARLTVDGTTKTSAKAIGDLYSKYCFENKQFSIDFLQLCLSGININDYEHHKPFMREMICCLRLKDSITNERVDYTMKQLIEIMKKNKQFYKATESCILYIFKLASRLNSVREWTYRKGRDLRWVEQWLKDNLYPPIAYQNSRIPLKSQMFKNRQAYFSPNAVYQSNNDNINILRSIMKGQGPDLTGEWDSDDEVPDDLPFGSRVDVYDSNVQQWTQGVVLYICNGQMLVKVLDMGERTKWIQLDSEEIAPEGTKVV